MHGLSKTVNISYYLRRVQFHKIVGFKTLTHAILDFYFVCLGLDQFLKQSIHPETFGNIEHIISKIKVRWLRVETK